MVRRLLAGPGRLRPPPSQFKFKRLTHAQPEAFESLRLLPGHATVRGEIRDCSRRDTRLFAARYATVRGETRMMARSRLVFKLGVLLLAHCQNSSGSPTPGLAAGGPGRLHAALTVTGGSAPAAPAARLARNLTRSRGTAGRVGHQLEGYAQD
jgi:hypothetical protein